MFVFVGDCLYDDSHQCFINSSLSASALEKELIMLDKVRVGIDVLPDEYKESLKDDKATSIDLRNVAYKRHNS